MIVLSNGLKINNVEVYNVLPKKIKNELNFVNDTTDILINNKKVLECNVVDCDIDLNIISKSEYIGRYLQDEEQYKEKFNIK